MDSIGEGRLFSRSLFQIFSEQCRSAAFDHQFGALANMNNEFMKAYLGLMHVTHVILYRNLGTD